MTMSITILHRRLAALSRLPALALSLLLAACAPQPTQDSGTARIDVAQKAWDLRQSGDYQAAAKEFLRVARRVDAPQDQVYRLYAVETYLLGGDKEAARELLADFPRDEAAADIKAWSMVLAARLAMADADFEAALQALDEAAGLDTGGSRARDIHELRAESLSRLGRPVEAIEARTRIEPLLADQAEIDQNREAIWALARGVAADQRPQLASGASDIVRGWLELAALADAPSEASATATAAAFQRWRLAFPNHPGESVFAAHYPQSSVALALPTAPKRIAVLLPLDGATANAGRAVRDGIAAAWLADGASGKPVIEVYDATSTTAAAALERAVADGAELLIGPLEKSAVEGVLRNGPPVVPMIALNQTANDLSGMTHVVQFALAPEDEARGAAEKARADGHLRAWVMTPDDQWGERVYRAFAERWQELGGSIVNQVSYSNNSHDFATPVKQLLDIEGSARRAAELEKTLQRDVVSEPQPNLAADMLFLGAFSLQARQIQPQLRFFGVRDLPIYSTSHVYMGDVDPRRDADLDGITFGDMPAIVVPNGALQALLNPDRPDKSGSYSRLFAMGVDAYRIIPRAAAMRTDGSQTFTGETGTLTVARDGKIHRELSWMRFDGGVPMPPAPPTPADEPATPATVTSP
jgi:hypothetical protein